MCSKCFTIIEYNETESKSRCTMFEFNEEEKRTNKENHIELPFPWICNKFRVDPEKSSFQAKRKSHSIKNFIRSLFISFDTRAFWIFFNLKENSQLRNL